MIRRSVMISMKLNEFLAKLTHLQMQGHGDLEVYYCHGASGDTGPLSNGFVRTITGDEEMGPFDMEPGEKYISVYAGN